jgi:hypothetical protein
LTGEQWSSEGLREWMANLLVSESELTPVPVACADEDEEATNQSKHEACSHVGRRFTKRGPPEPDSRNSEHRSLTLSLSLSLEKMAEAAMSVLNESLL